MTSYTKNPVTDYGAPTNGTSDATVAFQSLADFMSGTMVAGDDITVTVPAHVYNFSGNISLFPGVLGGITTVVNATGATFKAASGGTFFLSNQVAIRDDSTHSARVATANAGDTSITLLTPSQNSRFSVNQWIAVAGLNLQPGGSPPNPAFFEFRKITAINAGSGLISFSPPLLQQYLSTWPDYGGAAPDSGGPATIYALPPSWDNDITFNGLIVNQPEQTYVKCRKVTFNNGSSVGSGNKGVVPTVSQSMTFNSFDQTGVQIEVDKFVDELIYSGGQASLLQFQSMSCANTCALTNFTVGTISGTPRNLTINSGAVPSLQFGATGYGRTDAVTVNNSVISAISTVSANVQDVVAAGYTMAAGVIRWAKSNGPIAWAVPGTHIFFRGSNANSNNGGRIISVTDDGTDTIITTTMAGGFPSVPLQNSTRLDLVVHPCPVWNGSGNSGCTDIVDLNNSGAQGRPLFSYSKRTYTGSDLAPGASGPNLWGRIRAANIAVSQASTRSGALSVKLFGQFQAGALDPDNSATLWSPSLNVKAAATRSYVYGSGWSNAQSGDSLSDPGNLWFAGAQNPYASADISGEAGGTWPIMEIEVRTDQGLLPTAVAPLRLRLHA